MANAAINVQITKEGNTFWVVNEPVNLKTFKLKTFIETLQSVQKQTNNFLTELVEIENSNGDFLELVDEDDSDADENDRNKRKNVDEDKIKKKIKSTTK